MWPLLNRQLNTCDATNVRQMLPLSARVTHDGPWWAKKISPSDAHGSIDFRTERFTSSTCSSFHQRYVLLTDGSETPCRSIEEICSICGHRLTASPRRFTILSTSWSRSLTFKRLCYIRGGWVYICRPKNDACDLPLIWWTAPWPWDDLSHASTSVCSLHVRGRAQSNRAFFFREGILGWII